MALLACLAGISRRKTKAVSLLLRSAGRLYEALWAAGLAGIYALPGSRAFVLFGGEAVIPVVRRKSGKDERRVSEMKRKTARTAALLGATLAVVLAGKRRGGGGMDRTALLARIFSPIRRGRDSGTDRG